MVAYPQSFPAKAPNAERLTISRKQSATESTFTYAVQVVQNASQWALEFAWGAMTHVQAEAVVAWLSSLKGQVGTFRYTPRASSLSGLTGRTLAAAAYGYNTTLSAGGWAAYATSGLRAGQYLQVGDQLLRITDAAASADIAGHVVINIEPELRHNYTAGTGLNFATPSGIFRLTSSDGAGFTLTPDKKPEIGTIQAREVV